MTRRTANTNCIRRLPGVTAPATPTATTPAQPPSTIRYAAIALVVAGVLGVVAALTEYSSAVKQWLFDETKKADLKSSDVKSGKKAMPTDEHIRHTINSSTTPVVLISLVVLALLVYVAFSLWKGKYWTRWTVLAIFVVLTFFTGTPGGGLNGLLLVTSAAPAALRFTAFLSSLSMLVAVVLVFLRPSQAYLALNRPARKPRAAGGLFGPRPTPADTPPPATKSKPEARPKTKPATTRPASKTPTKPKVDVTAPDSSSRPRGKSRRSAPDDGTVD